MTKKCLVHNGISCNEDECTNKECENLDIIDDQLFCDLYFNQVGDI